MITVGSADAETSGKVRHAAPLSRPLGGRPCTCAESSAREGLELGPSNICQALTTCQAQCEVPDSELFTCN